MEERQRALAALVALSMLATPGAVASWSAFGGYEPNTPYDDITWMWPDAPTTPGRVYFNVVTLSGGTGVGIPFFGTLGARPVNPNVGAAGTNFELGAGETHLAIFGVWLDCNDDGYVGMAESALREYDARLLLDDGVCPAVHGSHNHWTAGAHNYNGVVSELIPIARQPDNGDRRIYRDDDARVWGDLGRPDAPPTGGTCAGYPLPRGTIATTGGALTYVDCRADVLGTWTAAMDAIGDPLGLRFHDPDQGASGALGGATLGGHDEARDATVYVSDCSDGQLANAGFVRVPGPSPGVGDPADPSLAGTYAMMREGFFGDCNLATQEGQGFYASVEGDALRIDPDDKRAADWTFDYFDGNRGQLPLSLVPGGYSGNAGVTSDYGVGAGGSRWSASAALDKIGPNALRIDLAHPDADVAPAHWLTFYAHVGKDTRDRSFVLPPASGRYGAWHCGDNDDGIRQGWNCDADLWYRHADGTPFDDDGGVFARPGDPYELRDVDCYDGRIGTTGIGVQPAFYGAAPC